MEIDQFTSSSLSLDVDGCVGSLGLRSIPICLKWVVSFSMQLNAATQQKGFHSGINNSTAMADGA